MRSSLQALTLALSLPAIVWQPRPVRAATPEAPLIMSVSGVAHGFARSLSPVRAE